MGVYIKGMGMPKGCATCPYCDRAWNKPKCKAKSMQGRFMEQRLNLDRTRQKWCPLVPVPPHGRLIDADALLADDNRKYDTYRGANGRDALLDDACHRAIQWSIENAPTIIPAEEVET